MKITYKIQRLLDVRHDIKHGLQIAFTGLDDTMTFNLDDYLVRHISKLLAQYEKQAEGFIEIDNDFRKYLNRVRGAFDMYVACLDEEHELYEQYKEEGMNAVEAHDAYHELLSKLREEMKVLFDKEFSWLWW